MTDSGDSLMDCSPLISAAQLGKLRLVRLLVEGGAQVNERNQRGETPLRADQSGSSMLKLIQFLLSHRADPNIQGKTGRTALMYACMERAGSDVDDTLTVLLDACRARGRDIIIIATDLSCDGSSVKRRYLNVPPSPESSPVSCMSPSDIELKTNSPNSEGENIFNFRGGGFQASPVLSRSENRYRQRLRSEPWLAIQNLAHLSQTYEKNTEDEDGCSLSTCELRKSDLKFKPKCRNQSKRRRKTLPDLLQPSGLKLTLSGSDTHLHQDPCVSRFPSIYRSSSLLLAPPNGLQDLQMVNRKKKQARSYSGFLPPLPGVSLRNVCRDPIAASASVKWEDHGSSRCRSVQLQQMRPMGSSETLYLL